MGKIGGPNGANVSEYQRYSQFPGILVDFFSSQLDAACDVSMTV